MGVDMINYLKPLIEKSLTRNFSAGSTILYQGEAPRHACVLISGVIRVFSISDNGDEQIITFHVKGEIFPSSWIFGKSSSTFFFYDALTDCKVAYLDRKELLDTMKSTPESSNAILDYFATSYAASLIRINALEQPKARSKLLYTLYYLCHRHVKDINDKTAITIPINLTHQNFASLVGLTRETAAMELGKLKKQGIITYKQQKYTVNIKRLLEIIGEDGFENIVMPVS